MASENEQQETAYRLEKLGTGAGAGWFSCLPERGTGLEEGLGLLPDPARSGEDDRPESAHRRPRRRLLVCCQCHICQCRAHDPMP